MRALSAAAFLFGCIATTETGAWASTFGTCTFTVNNVAFGNYNPAATSATTGSGSVSLDCILPTTVTVTISMGSSSSFSPRTMLPISPATGTLGYYLYTPSATNWGDGSASTATVSLTSGILIASSATIVGSITPRQNVSAGMFTDSPVVTANF